MFRVHHAVDYPYSAAEGPRAYPVAQGRSGLRAILPRWRCDAVEQGARDGLWEWHELSTVSKNVVYALPQAYSRLEVRRGLYLIQPIFSPAFKLAYEDQRIP